MPKRKSRRPSRSSAREAAICINVSQHMNFGDGTDKRCALVPAVGKVTIAILARNLLRLFDNFHAKPTRRPLGVVGVVAAVAAAAACAALVLGKKR